MIAESLLRLRDGRNAAAGDHVGPGDRTIRSRNACIANAVGCCIRIARLGRIAMANEPVENAGPPSSAAAARAATTQRVLLRGVFERAVTDCVTTLVCSFSGERPTT